MSRSFALVRRKTQMGLTLVELLIGLSVGLIITLAVGYLYTNSRQTYRVNDNVARMQENGRYAMEMIGRDLRMAGYWGCASKAPYNTLNNNNAYAFKFDTPIEGHEATGANSWSPNLDASVVNAVSGTDVLTLRTVFGDSVRVIQHPGGNPPGSADLKVTANSGLAQGDIVLVSDCRNAAVFQITHINNAAGMDNIVHNTGGSLDPGNFTKELKQEYEGGEIMRIATVTYYIRLNAAGRPALFRLSRGVAEELVENVENLQVTYGVDTDDNDDRAVTDYKTANDVHLDNAWNRVRAVRVRLLLVSPDDNLTENPQTFSFIDTTGDGIPDPVTATDRRLRYVFTSTIGLRNRLP